MTAYAGAMSQTLTRLLVHVVFSTRRREPLITPEQEPELFACMGGTCRNHASVLLAAGAAADHVHLLISLGKTIALSDLMLDLKRDSSAWMKSRVPMFSWQDGYAAFSIGQSGVDALRAYIAAQRLHHQQSSFQDELRVLCAKYGVDLDERHAWE